MKFNIYCNKFRIIPLFLFVLSLSACKKSNDNPPEPASTLVMTINFTDDFINPQLGAVVFASDSSGNLLADTAVSGNGTLRLYAHPGKAVPSKFTLTIATWEPSMHNFEAVINSYTDVSTGEWTLRGHRPDTLGHFVLNLSGVPQGALILYANAGFANLTTKTAGAVCLSYTDPDNLYLKFDKNGEQKQLWLTGIHPGQTYDVDMAQATDPVFRTIGLSGVFYEARVWGYATTDYENELPIMTNYSLGTPAGNQIRLSDMPGRFAGYHTELKLTESWDSGYTYSCRFTGDIPAAFSRINAQLVSHTVKAAGKAEIAATGDFTTSSLRWIFAASNNQDFRWTIYGDKNRTRYELPVLSPLLTSVFPVLALDSLSLNTIELTKYASTGSYPEYLGKRYDPQNPRSEDTFDASTLTAAQAK